MNEFVSILESFLSRHWAVTPSACGYLSVGDPSLVKDVRGGRTLRASTLADVKGWMERYEYASEEQRQIMLKVPPAPRARRQLAQTRAQREKKLLAQAERAQSLADRTHEALRRLQSAEISA